MKLYDEKGYIIVPPRGSIYTNSGAKEQSLGHFAQLLAQNPRLANPIPEELCHWRMQMRFHMPRHGGISNVRFSLCCNECGKQVDSPGGYSEVFECKTCEWKVLRVPGFEWAGLSHRDDVSEMVRQQRGLTT